MKRSAWPFVIALGLAACQDQPGPVAPARDADLAPPVRPAFTSEVIPGQYIVVFKNDVVDVNAAVARLIDTYGGTKRFTYSRALKGYAARMPDAVAESLRLNPLVAYVEQDRTVSLTTVQSGATFGIDRVDQRNLPLSTTYEYNADGTGVTVYIIDTGIRFDHVEFGGRASTGFDAVDGGSADDCNGHGTHVAGTVGGTTYGIAKNVSLVAVRVLDCGGSGATSGVIAGIDWVTGNHAAGSPAAANMSLGGGASTALDNAVINSIADGVTYGVAAGNGNFLGIPQDACGGSPARVGAALTIGSTTNTDARSSFSNYGTCVDLFAPGSSITSAWYTSATATNTISGTSMATPHVVGAAALYLQTNTSATPAQVETALESNATAGKVTNPGTGSPNLLLYTAFIGAGAPPPPPP
nr:S8 family peptidase [Acidobacteriota bacterium]